ncbi:MAG: oxidoreductase [Asticcacaulis sp.]|uniref:oxidoreductase n=1 Tax=Asticcacaulis sp. TaxID=1872648 RepID=UPI0039E6C332
MRKIIFITGVSTGFGRAIAGAAIAAGHTVIGTVRKPEDAAAFEALSANAHARRLDVTDTAAIAPLVAEVEQSIGPIDVLINNAGYGSEGILEETPLEEVRRQFEVNVFGPVAMIQAVLPFMRARKAGHIINITSMGGFITLPGISVYHGSKFALEGIGESLGKELAGLGIHVTNVEPGGFRTDWAGRSMTRTPRSIADYDTVMDGVRERRQAYHGHQVGDPVKLGRAVVELVANPAPPAHLLLGSDGLRLVREKLNALQLEIDANERITLSTDYED